MNKFIKLLTFLLFAIGSIYSDISLGVRGGINLDWGRNYPMYHDFDIKTKPGLSLGIQLDHQIRDHFSLSYDINYLVLKPTFLYDSLKHNDPFISDYPSYTTTVSTNSFSISIIPQFNLLPSESKFNAVIGPGIGILITSKKSRIENDFKVSRELIAEGHINEWENQYSPINFPLIFKIDLKYKIFSSWTISFTNSMNFAILHIPEESGTFMKVGTERDFYLNSTIGLSYQF